MDDCEGLQRSHWFPYKARRRGYEVEDAGGKKAKHIRQEERKKSTEPLALSSLPAHLY